MRRLLIPLAALTAIAQTPPYRCRRPRWSGGKRVRRLAARGASRSIGDVPANALRVMSEDTGGRTFHSGNDLETPVRAALDDTELTYTLTFFPDPIPSTTTSKSRPRGRTSSSATARATWPAARWSSRTRSAAL